MKPVFKALQVFVLVIAYVIFLAGTIFTIVGAFHFVHSFMYLSVDDERGAKSMAVALIKAVDLFLIAVVLFVFSLGLQVLFNNRTDNALVQTLPKWLQVRNFMELKIILWEAILTTLVISYLADVARIKIGGGELTPYSLLIPAGILLISLSLFFLKKGEHKAEH